MGKGEGAKVYLYRGGKVYLSLLLKKFLKKFQRGLDSPITKPPPSVLSYIARGALPDLLAILQRSHNIKGGGCKGKGRVGEGSSFRKRFFFLERGREASRVMLERVLCYVWERPYCIGDV